MIAHLVRQIVTRNGVLASIVTADWDDEAGEHGAWVAETDVAHRVPADAPDEVLNAEIACKTPYPFVDDGDGNAVGLLT